MLPVYRTSWANEAFLDTTTIEVNPPQPLHKGGGGGNTTTYTHRTQGVTSVYSKADFGL